MIFRIPAGKHYSRPKKFGFWFRRREWNWNVHLTDSCKYEPDPEDDTNKLCGVGFLFSHHQNSARFGWRYNPEIDQFGLYAYLYDKGIRSIIHLANRRSGQRVRLGLIHQADFYSFFVDGFRMDIPKKHKRVWTFRLGFYFGGNLPAPHLMTASITSL